MGTIAIREGQIFISRKEIFIEYITQRIQDELGSDSYEDDDSMLMGMEIAKKSETPHGISMSTNGFEDKIKSIEISHGRTRTPHEPLTESELSILRMELENDADGQNV